MWLNDRVEHLTASVALAREVCAGHYVSGQLLAQALGPPLVQAVAQHANTANADGIAKLKQGERQVSLRCL